MTPQIVIMTDAEVEQFEKDEGPGALLTDKGPLPLKALDVQAQLEGLIAEVSLTQTFVNTHAEPLEATYIFPLPGRAAVTGFRMEVAGRVVEGVLKEREAARQEYDEAIEAGHRAAITEEERPGVFTMRVGNIPAGESAVVRLTMVGPLAFESGEVTWRFPLVVAPRYIPGTPLDGRSVGDGVVPDTDAVPDASRITPPVLLPGYPNPVRFSLKVDVQPAGLPVRDFRSSLHAVVSQQLANGTTRFAVQPGDRLNRDFILRYQIGEATITTSLTLVPDANADSQEGTFVLTVIPPVLTESRKPKAESRPRDVVFVLDRSGSMDGWKMAAARRALARMIDTLTQPDRFTVLAFDEQLETPVVCAEGMVSASDRNRFRVIEWLAGIEARGGTEMAQPLVMAIEQLTAAEHDRVLVLITDGQVGNEDQILQALAHRLKGIRIFTLGIDTAVNEAFLRRLAALGGGSFDLVESEDRLDEVMDKVQRRVGKPFWTGLKVEADGIELEPDSQVPARLPDLFAGVPLTILGRYRGPAQGRIALSASDDAGQPMVRTTEAHVGANAAPAKIWARGRLRDLEDSWVVANYDSRQQMQEKIVALSLKFGVLCRFTAFVAVDRSEKVNQGGKQQHLIQPVELPRGWEIPTARTRSMSPGVFACKSIPPAGGFLGAAAPSMAFSMPPEDNEQEHVDSYLMEDIEEQEQNGHGETNGGPYEAEVEEFTLEIDLSAYRQRVREMLEELQADSDLRHALGVLAIKLQALVDDLMSIGASDLVIEPLTKLLEEIRADQLRKSAEQLLEKSVSVLTAFAVVVESTP